MESGKAPVDEGLGAGWGAIKLHFGVRHPALKSGTGASRPSTSAIAAAEGLTWSYIILAVTRTSQE